VDGLKVEQSIERLSNRAGIIAKPGTDLLSIEED